MTTTNEPKPEEVTIKLGIPKKKPFHKKVLLKVQITLDQEATVPSRKEFILNMDETYLHNIIAPTSKHIDRIYNLMAYLEQYQENDEVHQECYNFITNLSPLDYPDLSIELYQVIAEVYNQDNCLYDTISEAHKNYVKEEIFDILDEHFYYQNKLTDEQIKDILDEYLISKNIAN